MADSSNFIIDFWYYTGEETQRSNKPTNIVLDFVNPLQEKFPNRPFIIVTDSFYSSLKLAEELHSKKLGLLLSCRSDQPSFLFAKYLHVGLKKGETAYVFNKKFNAISYYDKAKLNLITNLFQGHKMLWNSNKSKQLPTSVYWYRKWLGPIDHADRQLHLYLPQHRNIKWTQALFRGLLKVAVNNCFIIAQQLEFVDSLLETELLLIDYMSNDHTLRQNVLKPVYMQKTTGTNHWPKKKAKSRDCAACLLKSKRSRTPYVCLTCGIHLHPDCFELYHCK